MTGLHSVTMEGRLTLLSAWPVACFCLPEPHLGGVKAVSPVGLPSLAPPISLLQVISWPPGAWGRDGSCPLAPEGKPSGVPTP